MSLNLADNGVKMCDVVDGGQAVPNVEMPRGAIPNSPSVLIPKMNQVLPPALPPQNSPKFVGNLPISVRGNKDPSTQFGSKSKEPPSKSLPSNRAEEFEQSTKYLVSSFVNHRLKKLKKGTTVQAVAMPQQKRGPVSGQQHSTFPWSYNNRSSEGISFMPRLGQVDKVAEALQALGDHLDSRYWQSFEQAFPADWLHSDDIEDLKNKFFITSKNLYCNAQAEAEAVHEEKINWGRIITHFCFTSQLACAAVLSKQYQLVAELTNWLTQFITGHLRVWIEQNGGWEDLVSYRRTLLSKSKWEDYNVEFTYGVIAVAVLSVFGFLAMKNYANSS